VLRPHRLIKAKQRASRIDKRGAFMENRYSKIIELVAANHGESAEAVRNEIAAAIQAAANNPDEIARYRFQMVFGSSEPSPERFLERVAEILGPMV